MSRVIDRFPHIRRAYLEMVYDNGGINRGRTEEDALDDTEPVMGAEGVDEADLELLDAWVGTLSDAEVETLVSGEETEMQALGEQGPYGGPDGTPLAGLFSDLFEVC